MSRGGSPPRLATVDLELSAGVATIRLARPEALNAFDRQLGEDLLAALRHVGADDGVRAVVLTGAGRAFSSGADLRSVRDDDVRTRSGGPNLYHVLSERFHPAAACIREMPKPVVAAVRGPAVGVGMSLALSCDFVVACESAYFMLAFVNVGLVPDGGASAFVLSRVGFTRGARLALLGERLGADEAVDCGLINAVYADDDLDDCVHELAMRLAAGPTLAYAGIKRQLNHWLFGRMAEQMELEASIQQRLTESADFGEGVAAFVEKRPPRFIGG
ncbi:enoyl-CoA hydratase [Amycolatopsis acidiphila]|uniref:Enoyl-CoA hydratase n=1 Tax=Amycolatopsis acidiphila TaxID=715473 RepID=A0A558AI40_9PSEU|nr:enoyl-CoA hydratase [Amycolatopsis acidiphila]